MRVISKFLIVIGILLVAVVVIKLVFNNSPMANWIGGLLVGTIASKILDE